MKSALATVLLLAGSVVLLADESKMLALTADDNGKTVTVKVGQAVVVSLKGNPTTGFSWALAGIEGQSVALDGKVQYKENANPEGMVGVPGMFQAKFKATKLGQFKVKLEYRRPWEKDKKAVQTFEITVVVEKVEG